MPLLQAPIPLPDAIKGTPLVRQVRQNAWPTVDQMMISASNFATMVFMARGLEPREFGSFALVYSVLLFANSLQSGFITQSHNVLGATRRGEDYVRYTTSSGLLQLMFAATASLLTLLAAMVAREAGAAWATLLIALSPAIFAWQLQEFARRVLYTEGRVAAAAINDLVSYVGQAVLIIGFGWWGRLDGPIALYIIAITSALGAALGAWQLRGSLALQLDISAFVENWQYGKWLAASEIVGYWLSTEMFVYLAALYVSVAAAGVLKAVHVVFGPTRVLAYVITTVLPIRLTRTLASGGKKAMHAHLVAACSLAVPLLGGYCVTAAIFSHSLLSLLYGHKYAGHAIVLALYAAATFLSYMPMLIGSSLRAQRRTRLIFTNRLVASLIAIPIGWALILAFEVRGAVLAMIVMYAVMTYMYWRAYRGEQSRDSKSEAAAGSLAHPQASDLPRRHLPSIDFDGDPALLGGLFETVNQSAVPYCVLHGYSSYPETVPSDVDCAMPRHMLPARLASLLLNAPRKLPGRVIQWMRGATEYLMLACQAPDGTPRFLALDICGDYELLDRKFYSSDELLAGRTRHQDFWVPQPEIEFGCYLVRRVAKGELNAEQGKRLTELFRRDSTGCRSQIARFWTDGAAQLAAAASTGDWETVRQDLPALRRELLRRSGFRAPLNLFNRWLRRTFLRVARWVRGDSGLYIVFLGPDGAGKSSVTQAVRRQLAPAFARTVSHAFPPALRSRGRDMGTNTAPHATSPRSPLASSIRALCYWWVYHGPGYFLTDRLEVARSSLVLYDRHLLDTLVDPLRYRYSGPMWLLRLICRFIPRPHLVILLDAPPELIQSRKSEVPLEETSRQRREYLRLVRKMPNGRIIDASQPLEQVISQANAVILEYLAARTEARFQRRPAAIDRPEGAETQLKGLLHQAFPDVPADLWEIRKLGEGVQSRVFEVASSDGRTLWQDQTRLVIKIYKPRWSDLAEIARDEFESLERLYVRVNGRDIEGWMLSVPRPIEYYDDPHALLMTSISGTPLQRFVQSESGFDSSSIESISKAIVWAMEAYWSGEPRLYGDINLENVMCDPRQRMLAFVDPGMPEKTFLCHDVAAEWFPRSRDLAYMLFDGCVGMRSAATDEVREHLRKLLESVLRRFVDQLADAQARHRLLDEIRGCTRVHLRRIPLSPGPAGIWRFFVRRRLARMMDATLAHLARHPAPAEATTCAPAQPSLVPT